MSDDIQCRAFGAYGRRGRSVRCHHLHGLGGRASMARDPSTTERTECEDATATNIATRVRPRNRRTRASTSDAKPGAATPTRHSAKRTSCTRRREQRAPVAILASQAVASQVTHRRRVAHRTLSGTTACSNHASSRQACVAREPVRGHGPPRPDLQARPQIPALGADEAAIHASAHPLYKERYQRTKRRLGRQRGAKVAQIELARKLTEAIWYMLTRNQPFKPFAPEGAISRLTA